MTPMYEINRERLQNTFIDLVKRPSPSWDEKLVIEYLTPIFDEMGVSWSLHPCGRSHNLLARIGGEPGRRALLFSCHMDTVVPCENVVPIVKGDRITTDGNTVLGGDDKAAIAAFIEAMRVLKESGMRHGPLEFLFSCAEEIGLYGIKGFDLSLIRAGYAFVFDSGGDIGGIVLQAPTQLSMELFVKGKAAHAGMEPEKGVSAIRVLSEIITRIPHGRIDKDTTTNAGVISGGKATNIVAENAYCKLEVRSIKPARLRSVEARIKKTATEVAARHGAKIKVTRNLEYTGFSLGEESPVVKMAASAVRKIGRTPRYESSGGGSDTNIINRAGIKAVNLSIGMRSVHTTKEFIHMRDIASGARLVLALIDSA